MNAKAKPESKFMPAWKVIFRMIQFRPWYWLVDFFSVLVFRAMWQIAPGLVMREFFNLLSGDAATGLTLWTVVALLFGTLIGRIVADYGFVYADPSLFSEVNTLIRGNLLKHVLRRPGAVPLPDSPGEAVSRFRNDVVEIPLFVIWINDILVGLLVIVVSIGLMATISIPVTIIGLAPLLLIGLVANAVSDQIENLRRASRQATGKVTGFIGELFGTVLAVKVANAEKNVIDHLHQINDERRRLSLRERLFNEILDSLFNNTSSLSTGAILLLAGHAIRSGSLSIGDFSLFVFLLQSMGDLTTFGGMLFARYRQLNVSIERMYRLMQGAPIEGLVESNPVDLHNVIKNKPEALPKLTYPRKSSFDRIETCVVRGLTYRYPNSENGVFDINLTIRRGTLTVITGRIGSGKTTLLRVLLGLLPKDSGEIYWNNHKISKPGEFFLPPRSAYTPQAPRLFSSSLRENILLGLQRNEDEIRQAMYLAVMEQDLESFRHGLETKVGPRGVRLSGGQSQRTAAARMFIRQAELLVFDDLSSALDVATEQALWERIFAQNGATCLVVSHRKPVLQRADHIIVLKNGCIEAEGKLLELLENCEEMRSLWQHEHNVLNNKI